MLHYPLHQTNPLITLKNAFLSSPASSLEKISSLRKRNDTNEVTRERYKLRRHEPDQRRHWCIRRTHVEVRHILTAGSIWLRDIDKISRARLGRKINNSDVTFICFFFFITFNVFLFHSSRALPRWRLATDYEFSVRRNQIAEIIHVMTLSPLF